MNAKPPDTVEPSIELLGIELAVFTDRLVPLLSHQLQAFKTIYDLLQEDGESLRKRSKQRRSEVSRVRDLVADIYLRIGPEVFFLCIIALPVSTLAKLKPRLFIRKLEDWWRETHHPQGLKLAAIGLCRDNSISNIITSYRKRQYPELSILLGEEAFRWKPGGYADSQQINDSQSLLLSSRLKLCTTMSWNNPNVTTQSSLIARL